MRSLRLTNRTLHKMSYKIPGTKFRPRYFFFPAKKPCAGMEFCLLICVKTTLTAQCTDGIDFFTFAAGPDLCKNSPAGKVKGCGFPCLHSGGREKTQTKLPGAVLLFIKLPAAVKRAAFFSGGGNANLPAGSFRCGSPPLFRGDVLRPFLPVTALKIPEHQQAAEHPGRGIAHDDPDRRIENP